MHSVPDLVQAATLYLQLQSEAMVPAVASVISAAFLKVESVDRWVADRFQGLARVQ
jgi:hypothetical protein